MSLTEIAMVVGNLKWLFHDFSYNSLSCYVNDIVVVVDFVQVGSVVSKYMCYIQSIPNNGLAQKH